MQLAVADNIAGLQEALAGVARASGRVALVPTMGALHAGHMALIAEARKHADFVVASIFVNPKQFGPNEDYGRYPRALESDLKKLGEAGAQLAYTPSVEDMYPEGYSTTISPGALGQILCGQFRPGHFDGVATVVGKLLLRCLPHVALFGEKDYQQLCIIRRLVTDLDIPMEIIGLPTIREADGLALSSRNAYLTPEERATAPLLYKTLKSIRTPADIEPAKAALTQAGFKLDYLEIRDAETLAPATSGRVLVAAWLGKTRLIDNVELS